MDDCLFHNDRCHFDIVTRDLRKGKVLSRVHAYRLAMCVCSCRRNKFKLNTLVTNSELQEMVSYLEHCSNKETWPTSVTTLVQSVLRNVHIEQYSASMLTLVLYRAVHDNNYDLLESLRRKDCSEKKIKDSAIGMTPAQFELMMNKKLKKSPIKMDVMVPLFAGNSKKFEANETLKHILSVNKDIIMKIMHKENGQYMDRNEKMMKVKLAGKDLKKVQMTATHLRHIGSEIQKSLDVKREVEYRKRKEIKASRRQYAEFMNNQHDTKHGFNDLTSESLEYKSSLEDFYVRRKTANKIGVKTKTENPLKDGHCINCLDKFTSLKDNKECRYHPGYIDRDNLWSCCTEKAASDHPSFLEHSSTGCCFGIHNWRHGKNLKKEKRRKMNIKDLKDRI